jgi:hypothetical protein
MACGPVWTRMHGLRRMGRRADDGRRLPRRTQGGANRGGDAALRARPQQHAVVWSDSELSGATRICCNTNCPLLPGRPRIELGAAFPAIDGGCQPPGANGLPSDAGMLARIHAALLEISTSTTIVAT